MAGTSATIHIHGLRELDRDLGRLNRGVQREMRDALKDAAEPVRATAESYAFGGIRNIGNEWGLMRVGFSGGTVYVAPATRNRGGSPRPRFGTLLLSEAMMPALERHASEVEARVADMFDRVAAANGFAGIGALL